MKALKSVFFMVAVLCVAATVEGTIVFNAEYTYDENAGNAKLPAGAGGWGDYNRILRMGPDTQIDYCDGGAYATAAATSEELTWYNFKMDMDSASGTYDLYIDDVLIQAGVGFRSQDPDGIANVMIRWTNKMNTVMYIDDIIGYLR